MKAANRRARNVPGPVVFDLVVLQIYSVMKDTVLAAIPFFLFMGFMLEQSGIMERLFNGIKQLLSGLNGSLHLAVLIAATIFAAATGIVGSSVTLLGVMAGSSMIKSGYDMVLQLVGVGLLQLFPKLATWLLSVN